MLYFALKRGIRLFFLLVDIARGNKKKYSSFVDYLCQLLGRSNIPLEALILGGSLPPAFVKLDSFKLNKFTLDYISEGDKFIDAHDLSSIDDCCVDFYASSNMLEHCVSPLLVLREAYRVLKPGGHMLLIVPHYLLCQDIGGKPSELSTLSLSSHYHKNFTTSSIDYLTLLNESLKSYNNIFDLSFCSKIDNLNYSIQLPYTRFHLWRFDLNNLIPLVYMADFSIKKLCRYRSDIMLIAQKTS